MRWIRLLTISLVLIGCDRAKLRGEIRCRALTGELPGDARFDECSDGAARRLRCSEGADDWTCACEVNGKLQRSFSHNEKRVQLANDAVRAIEIANRRCKWELYSPR